MDPAAINLRLTWDTAAAAVGPARHWVLSAMQKHGQALVAMLWRILQNEQDVCDAYQDAFVQLSSLPQARRPDNVKAFLFRASANVAITMLRRRRLHQQACEAIAARAPREHHDASDLDAAALRDELQRHIARLPEPLRNVVLLKDLADLSYREAADILGISTVAARVYRCRAIALLSQWMARPEDEP